MRYSLTPNEYFFRVQDAQTTLSNLEGVAALIAEAIDFSSDALRHSTLSRTASETCLDLYVSAEVDYGRGRSQQNIDYASEGLSKYVYGDTIMAENSTTGLGTIDEHKGFVSQMDAYNKARGGDGTEVCTPDNPAGEANYDGSVEARNARLLESGPRLYGANTIEK